MKEKIKEWPQAGVIPKASRNILDKVEYWFYKAGISSQRMFCKWFATHCAEYTDSIEIDTKDIKFY